MSIGINIGHTFIKIEYVIKIKDEIYHFLRLTLKSLLKQQKEVDDPDGNGGEGIDNGNILDVNNPLGSTYAVSNHGITGGVDRLHLFDITALLLLAS